MGEGGGSVLLHVGCLTCPNPRGMLGRSSRRLPYLWRMRAVHAHPHGPARPAQLWLSGAWLTVGVCYLRGVGAASCGPAGNQAVR